MSEKPSLLFPNATPLPYKLYEGVYSIKERRYNLLLFSDCLESHDFFKSLDIDDKLNIVKKIEDSCWNASIKFAIENDIDLKSSSFILSYKFNCGNLVSNLENDNGKVLSIIQNAVHNNIDELDRIAYIEAEELYPDTYTCIKEKIKRRTEVKNSLKTCTNIRCRTCGKKECTLERMQIRSLDEGTNYRATCNFCKNTWII